MGVSGQRLEKQEYEKIKGYIRRKYASRDIQQLCKVSTNIITVVRHSTNYADFYEKQYGETPPDEEKNQRTSEMYKYNQVIGTLREQGKLMLEIKDMLKELIEELH